jgi:hypothetical protein
MIANVLKKSNMIANKSMILPILMKGFHDRSINLSMRKHGKCRICVEEATDGGTE